MLTHLDMYVPSECPTGCNTCTVDYADNSRTKCTSGQCATWDGRKAYTDGADGACQGNRDINYIVIYILHLVDK
jgi:hypothetical protein